MPALAEALERTLAHGESEEALHLALLKRIPLELSWRTEALVRAFMGSGSPLLRARLLVARRTAIRHSLSQSRGELEATAILRKHAHADTDALCEKYCMLLREEGPDSRVVRDLACRAQVWARHRLDVWWYPSAAGIAAEDVGRCAAGLTALRAFRDDGQLTDAVREFVMSGAGTWRAAADDWSRALDAVLPELEPIPIRDEETLAPLIHRVAACHPPTMTPDRADSADTEVEPLLRALTESEAEPRTRYAEEDVAVEWLKTREEIGRELEHLRSIGRFLPSLSSRMATGHGLSLMSDEDYAFVRDARLHNLFDD